MIRLLGPGDEPAVDAFLAEHAASSMFLRSNLRAGGIVDRGQTWQGTWFGAFDPALTGVACHAWNGMILVQAPVQLADLVDAAVAASRRTVDGLSGPWDQVVAARAHLGLTDRPAAIDGGEDLFVVELSALIVPEAVRSGQIRVRPAVSGDRPWIDGWREAFDRAILPGLPEESYGPRARGSVESLVAAGHLMVAEDGGVPVAMSTFNAALPDTVQIGGVWTPDAQRSRGYARSVVAGSLLAARARGVSRAILFTDPANAAAQRAYRALGFEVVGTYGVVLFR